MARAKNLVYGYTTGETLYAVVVREEDGYFLDSSDGVFKSTLAGCTDPYCNLTENANNKGRYKYTTAQSVWQDGYYTATIYAQAGGSPSLAADAVLANAQVFISQDAATVAPTPQAGDLCALADVKSALNIGSGNTSKDSAIQTLISDASAMISNYCQRTFPSTQHTEYFSPGYDNPFRVQRNSTRLVLYQYPIISISSIYDDADQTWDDANDLVAASDYSYQQRTVTLKPTGTKIFFHSGYETVRVIYTAGYATIPADLKRAAIMFTVHLYYANDRAKQNIASENIGGQSVVYKDQRWPKEVETILAIYKRPSRG